MYRKFSITNSKGQTFDMTRDDAFFASPKGLGTKSKNSYTAIGSNYAVTQESVSQKTPQGTMVFRGYEQYDEFMDIIKYKPLKLKYTPYKGCDLYIDCDSYEISKEERDKSGRLKCTFKLFAVSTWYKAVMAYRNERTSDGKVYPYIYDYKYIENKVGMIAFENHSNLEAYVKLTIVGPAKNPVWSLKQGGQTVMEGKMFVSIQDNQRLIVNSDPLNYEIAIYDDTGSLVADVYEDSDFSTDRFLYLPCGASVLSCAHEGDTELKIWAEVRENVE